MGRVNYSASCIFLAVLLLCENSTSTINLPVETTWSNRLGLDLTPIASGVWAAERSFVWNGINVGGRSVICRVGDGTLLVHSPVEWTTRLGNCLEALGGGVGHVVSPNYEHLKYAKQWQDIYPKAKRHGCPGLMNRLTDVQWAGELGIGKDPSEFSKSIETVFFDCEVNPFTNKAFFNEVVLFHTASKSIIMTDTFWNYPSSSLPNYYGIQDTGSIHICPKVPVEYTGSTLPAMEVPFGTKSWKFGMDKIFLPFYKKLMVGSKGSERREKYEIAVSKILAWEPQIIVPCHGDVIRGKELCRKVLEEHFLG
jgi:Domain of unknown function (DUF4336)